MGGQYSDCAAWLHSADGCSNRPELKCHKPSAEKRPADRLYKHWHFFPAVIECSLKKSTQWIPWEFGNAVLQSVYSLLYFTVIESVSCSWRVESGEGGIHFRWAVLTSVDLVYFTLLCSWYHRTLKRGNFVVISESKRMDRYSRHPSVGLLSPQPPWRKETFKTFAKMIAWRNQCLCSFKLFHEKPQTFMSVERHKNITSTPANERKILTS